MYSLAWSALAFLIHQDPAADVCIARLQKELASRVAVNVDTLSLAAIAIDAAEGAENPFQVLP